MRRGDIDSRKVSNHTAQEGARIHRRLQKEAGDAYQSEVFQNRKRDRKGQVDYRKDVQTALFYDEEKQCWVIDEIKTSEPSLKIFLRIKSIYFLPAGDGLCLYLPSRRKVDGN